MTTLLYIACALAAVFALGGVMLCVWIVFCETVRWLAPRQFDAQGRDRLGL